MAKSETRKVWSFFALAFAMTWAFAVPQALLTPPDAEPALFDVAQLGALGPAIAAVVMLYREAGRAGLREFFTRVIKWRFGLVWYLAILLVPLIWFGILPAIGLYALRYGTLPAFLGPSHGAPPWRDAWWFFFYILLIGGGQEELGWRGYALPKLQTRYSAAISSLILGIVWSLWHLPMLFVPGSSLHGVPFPVYAILLTAQTFVYTWLYNNTESILACVLYHTWSNFAAAYLTVNITDPMLALLMLAMQFGVVGVLLVVFGPKRLSRRRCVAAEGADSSEAGVGSG
jgi:membrane protease YdiL (CAAX protease family)